MKLFQHFLGGMVALGLHAGMAAAQIPAAALPTLPPAGEAAPAVTLPAVPGASDGGCGKGCDGPACNGSGWLGGAGLYLLQPYFENNPAYIENNRAAGTTKVTASQHVDVSTHMEVAPLVWLGYVGDNGLGGRVRYWYFREGTEQSLDSPNRFVTAHPGGLALLLDQARALDVTTKLELQVLDLECLQDFRACNWDFLASAGLRLAKISENYNAFALTHDGLAPSLLSGHSFYGLGPVLAAEARRPLGASGLTLYGSARGSVLFGSAHQSAFLPLDNDAGVDHRDRGVVVGELELGLEYGRTIGRSRLFGQVALVGQDWLGAGSASRSTIQATPGNDFTGGGYSMDSDIALVGLALRVGVNY